MLNEIKNKNREETDLLIKLNMVASNSEISELMDNFVNHIKGRENRYMIIMNELRDRYSDEIEGIEITDEILFFWLKMMVGPLITMDKLINKQGSNSIFNTFIMSN